MAEVNEYEGALSYVNSSGVVTRLYPDIKPDTGLEETGKAADAKTVGEKLTALSKTVTDNKKSVDSDISAINTKLGKALYIQSFDADTGTLNTVSSQ